MQDGKLYINLTYARAGTLVLGGLDNQNGTLQMLDANGNLIGSWDNTGASINGSIKNAVDTLYGRNEVEISNGEIVFRVNNADVGTILSSNVSGTNSINITSNGSVYINEGNGSSVYIVNGVVYIYGNAGIRLSTNAGLYMNGNIGANGFFVDSSGRTMTVENGIITKIQNP